MSTSHHFREEHVHQGVTFRALLTDPPEQAAESVVWLASGQGDVLTGRYLSAKDDVSDLARQSAQIQQTDQYTLRLIP